jgi:23S rRNA pseudouridine1911/1915/1917 synthase
LTDEREEREFVLPGPRPSSFVVTVPIGRQGRRGSKVKLAAGRQPLPARTEIALLENRPGGALVEARLARGRAHQVRAHLAYLGIPVSGDGTYGEVLDAAEATNDGLHLHAWIVSIVHPVTSQLLRIEAPPPGWARCG